MKFVIGLIIILLFKFAYNTSSDFKTISECYMRFGCINFTKEWYDPIHRPINVKPFRRQAINTKFMLFTPSNDKNLVIYDALNENPEHVRVSNYNASNKVMFLVHDFTAHGHAGWIKRMAKDSAHWVKRFNVISVDWHEGALPPFIQAISNARVVAKEIEILINILQKNFELKLSNVHLVGHGVGAHICGYVGKSIKNIGQITGLDPTGLYFEGMSPCVKLNRHDAEYVEVIHTDGVGIGRQGTLELMGNVDFFINNGSYQPGCRDKHIPLDCLKPHDLKRREVLAGCSHKRAYKYYVEALNNRTCQFIGYNPPKIELYRESGCYEAKTNTLICAPLGFDVDLKTVVNQTHVILYIYTCCKKPYCLHMYDVRMSFAFCDETENELNGYFDLNVADEEHSQTMLIEVNKNPRTYKKLISPSVTNFIEYSPVTIFKVKDICLTFHMTSFCPDCVTCTCVSDLIITQMWSKRPLTNYFGPANGSYTVLHNNEPSVAFKKISNIVPQSVNESIYLYN